MDHEHVFDVLTGGAKAEAPLPSFKGRLSGRAGKGVEILFWVG